MVLRRNVIMISNRRIRTIVFALAISLATVFLPQLSAYPTGTTGAVYHDGCTCHDRFASEEVEISLNGLPESFIAGEEYVLEISIIGGPEEGGENSGGFNMRVDIGTLSTLDNSVQISDGEATHTESGNDQRTWDIQWSAPDSDSQWASFVVIGNSVDGDGINDQDDSWNIQKFELSGQNARSGLQIDIDEPAWLVIVGSLLSIAILIILALWRNEVFGMNELKHWLTTTDHKDIGVLYLWASIIFSAIGLALSVLIRLQLVIPDNSFMTGGLYNEAVTMHGAVMVLFAISPMAFAFANYIVPLQIGARDMAFPRLNALSFWTLVLGGLTAASGFFFGGAADVGWTFYSPLTDIEYTPGSGVSLAGAGLVLLIISVTGSTINFLVTILRHRIPGMDMRQMPMYTWNILFTVILMLIIFPALFGAVLMLIGDRFFDTLFFHPDIDGTTWWLHIFWFFGHPEVYVVLLPGLGMAMEVVPTFVRRELYGRNVIIWSLAVASIISVLVWAHHMFITGIDPTFRKLETIGTELVSVPFGLIYLCLLATFYKSKPDFSKLPLAFVMGAIGIFLIGGITGVYLSSVAMDVQLRGTYYLVAHFHYTLGSVAVMTLGGIYYWYPKIFGRMLDEGLGWWHFWLTFLGINITFIPLFGLWDMPRRIYVYQESAGWGDQQLVSTIGSIIVFVAQLIFFWNFTRSMHKGEVAGNDPWGGTTFEWSTSSPPPKHNFEKLPEMN
jgi:heme/copper-type cytochrome/quinol oxidase subunit 1